MYTITKTIEMSPVEVFLKTDECARNASMSTSELARLLTSEDSQTQNKTKNTEGYNDRNTKG